MLRRMPYAALEHHVQWMPAEIGVHHARAAAVGAGLPPFLHALEDAFAEARDVLCAAQRRARVGHDALVGELAAVVHGFEERLRDPEYVMREHAYRPVAVAKRLVEPVPGNLPHEPRRGREHDAEPGHQLLGAQALLQ